MKNVLSGKEKQHRKGLTSLWQIAGSIALLGLAPLLVLAATGIPVPLFRTLLALMAALLLLAAAVRGVELLRDHSFASFGFARRAGGYRLLVVDVDGTLVGSDLTISPRLRATASALSGRGVAFALCTGRSPAAAARFVRDLGLTGPHIFFDGALVADPAKPNGVVYYCSPEVAALHELAGRCRDENLPIELYAREAYFVEQPTDASAWHSQIQGVAPRVARFEEVLAEYEIIKGELIVAGIAAKEALARLETAFSGRLRFSRAHVPGHDEYEVVNVVHPAVSKGVALRHLARHHGLSLEEVVAAGDGANDIPLLETAGLGIAMGNAPASVKAAAQLVTATADDDGLALAIERLLLD